jgi:hypothetical protein
MTEMRTEYRVKAGAKNTGVTWRYCPQCRREFGFESSDGRYLWVGKVKVISMRAECGDCGYELWWKSTDRYIRKLTNRRK